MIEPLLHFQTWKLYSYPQAHVKFRPLPYLEQVSEKGVGCCQAFGNSSERFLKFNLKQIWYKKIIFFYFWNMKY